ncbi:MAG: hypothetical protein ACTSRP_27070 [Candidatus Helarchaeota archaeon]
MPHLGAMPPRSQKALPGIENISQIFPIITLINGENFLKLG